MSCEDGSPHGYDEDGMKDDSHSRKTAAVTDIGSNIFQCQWLTAAEIARLTM